MNNKVFSCQETADVLHAAGHSVPVGPEQEGSEKYACFFDDYGLFIARGHRNHSRAERQGARRLVWPFYRPVFSDCVKQLIYVATGGHR